MSNGITPAAYNVAVVLMKGKPTVWRGVHLQLVKDLIGNERDETNLKAELVVGDYHKGTLRLGMTGIVENPQSLDHVAMNVQNTVTAMFYAAPQWILDIAKFQTAVQEHMFPEE